MPEPTPIQQVVELNRDILIEAFRGVSPWWCRWFIGKAAPVLARIALEVCVRMLAPVAVPFLNAMLRTSILWDAAWAERARAVLAVLATPATSFHPATAAAFAKIAPELLVVTADDLDDPSLSPFVSSPVIPENLVP